MRQVRTCDFCGDDATGMYEPLPPSIPDAPRLLLCDGCRERLATVVDPLLSRLEVDAGPTGAGPDPGGRRGDGVGTAVDSHESDLGSGRGADWPGQEPRSSGSGSAQSNESMAADRADPTSPSSDSTADGIDVSDSRDASGRSKRDRSGTPHGYRKVMRFLENRQLPIEREEAEMLAAEAYELDPADVTESIDHAVQYGRLREVHGQLKR